MEMKVQAKCWNNARIFGVFTH